MFHTPVYDRGAMTLQALRQKLGDDTFLAIVRAWYAENRNVTTADFIALAERVSGQQLDAFFDAWLYTEGKPQSGEPGRMPEFALRARLGAGHRG